MGRKKRGWERYYVSQRDTGSIRWKSWWGQGSAGGEGLVRLSCQNHKFRDPVHVLCIPKSKPSASHIRVLNIRLLNGVDKYHEERGATVLAVNYIDVFCGGHAVHYPKPLKKDWLFQPLRVQHLRGHPWQQTATSPRVTALPRQPTFRKYSMKWSDHFSLDPKESAEKPVWTALQLSSLLCHTQRSSLSSPGMCPQDTP